MANNAKISMNVTSIMVAAIIPVLTLMVVTTVHVTLVIVYPTITTPVWTLMSAPGIMGAVIKSVSTNQDLSPVHATKVSDLITTDVRT